MATEAILYKWYHPKLSEYMTWLLLVGALSGICSVFGAVFIRLDSIFGRFTDFLCSNVLQHSTICFLTTLRSSFYNQVEPSLLHSQWFPSLCTSWRIPCYILVFTGTPMEKMRLLLWFLCSIRETNVGHVKYFVDLFLIGKGWHCDELSSYLSGKYWWDCDRSIILVKMYIKPE